MIKNEREYRITKAHLADFEGGLTANDQGHFLEVDLMAVGLHGVEGGPPVEGGDLIGIGAQEHDPGRVVAA